MGNIKINNLIELENRGYIEDNYDGRSLLAMLRNECIGDLTSLSEDGVADLNNCHQGGFYYFELSDKIKNVPKGWYDQVKSNTNHWGTVLNYSWGIGASGYYNLNYQIFIGYIEDHILPYISIRMYTSTGWKEWWHLNDSAFTREDNVEDTSGGTGFSKEPGFQPDL